MRISKRFLFVIVIVISCMYLSCALAATMITNNSISNTVDSIIPIANIKSSTRRYDQTNNIVFKVENLLDGDPTTTWQPAVKSYQDFYMNGIGEYVDITFRRKSVVSEVWIRNGHCRNESYYIRNSRPAIITISFKNRQGNQLMTCASPVSFQMDDDYNTTSYSDEWRDGYQCLRLPEPVEADAITLTIEDLYRSSESQSRDNWYYVCMSDIYVVGK